MPVCFVDNNDKEITVTRRRYQAWGVGPANAPEVGPAKAPEAEGVLVHSGGFNVISMN